MKKLILTLCLAATGLWGARAQMRLTLESALDLALSENPTIKVAEMEVERYDYVKRQTWGNLLPQLSLGGQYQHTFIKQNMSKGFDIGAKQYDNLSASAQLTVPLFAPQVYRTMKMNDTEMAVAVETARASRITLASEVRKAFYNILLAEQSLRVLRESEATVTRTVEETRLKYDNGLAAEYDLLTAQVQLSNLRPTILQTETSITVAKRLLKMYLSIPEGVEIEVEGELDAMRDAVIEGADLLSTDISQNSDLRTLELQEQLLTRSLRVANASRWPTVAAVGNFSFSGTNMGSFDFDSMIGGGEPKIDRSWYWQHPLIGGIQLSVPLFSGLTKMNKSREIKNQIAQLAMQRDYARQQIEVQVRSAINDLMTAREKMYAQEKTVEQAAKAYSISETRYGAGAGTMLELNTAQLSLTQAQLNFSQAIYDYLAAKAEYDRIVGRER